MTAPTVNNGSRLPVAKTVRDLFNDLLGRDVDVAPGAAWAPKPRDGSVVAEFVDDRLTLRVVALLDCPLACFAGAAIGLMPAGGAKDMAKEKDPSPLLLENLREILNVFGSMLNHGDFPHVKFGPFRGPEDEIPADVVQVLGKIPGRLDLIVKIDGYGDGRLALITT